jgi:hypothetical protein
LRRAAEEATSSWQARNPAPFAAGNNHTLPQSAI